MLKTIIIGILLAYLMLCLIVLFFTNVTMFPAPHPSYEDNENLIKLTLPNGEEIAAIYLPSTTSKYTILYSHGNGEDIGYIHNHLLEFVKRGFSVFAYDYPGYGRSKGMPNESNLNESILSAYKYLENVKGITPDKIILYGVSLGCGPSIELASKMPVAGLILQSPFLSAFRVVTRIKILPWDKFENINKIKNVKAPTLIIHGNEDDIIPFYHGKVLYKNVQGPKKYFWVDKGDHNRLVAIAGDSYWTCLQEFIEELKNHKQ